LNELKNSLTYYKFKFKLKTNPYVKYIANGIIDKGKVNTHTIEICKISDYDYELLPYKEVTNNILIDMLWDFKNKTKLRLAINLINLYENKNI
jgi:hypothetical protein